MELRESQGPILCAEVVILREKLFPEVYVETITLKIALAFEDRTLAMIIRGHKWVREVGS